MTKRGEGKSVSSTSAAKRERARKLYLQRKGILRIIVNYDSIDGALKSAGLVSQE